VQCPSGATCPADLSKIDASTLLFDSSFGSGVYNHIFFPSIWTRRVNRYLILPTSHKATLEAHSADYGPKSVRGGRMKLLLH